MDKNSFFITFERIKSYKLMIKNVFDADVHSEITKRINSLTKDSKAQWGKMDVAQMLAHLSVSYEFIYTNKHPKPKGLKKILLKTFVKKIVVGPKPYKRNSRTAPEFMIVSSKIFESEKAQLLAYLDKTYEHTGAYFHNKESLSFGKLTQQEWNNMFYKHLDHHLKQFNV